MCIRNKNSLFQVLEVNKESVSLQDRRKGEQQQQQQSREGKFIAYGKEKVFHRTTDKGKGRAYTPLLSGGGPNPNF